MKKNFKRAMAAVMAAALTVTLAAGAPEAEAAKKPKLAKKSVTVTVKKSKTVKIKNVKAKKVKKITVKSAKKSIATAKKSGKTAVKVTGKKQGSTKVNITLKIKGQKKATKLTLKVKVKKAAPNTPSTDTTPAPSAAATATAAPGTNGTAAPGTNGTPAPGTNGTPAPGTNETAAPATDTPATKEPSTPKPAWTPDPSVAAKVENFTLTYNYEFPAARQVLFTDAENYDEVAPADGIDVRYYDKVIVTYSGIEMTEEATKDLVEEWPGWGGKATLSSTDEGLGETAYTDGLFRVYLNDVAGGMYKPDTYYEDGKYTISYAIGEENMVTGWEFDDAAYIDCVSAQLGDNAFYDVEGENPFTLKSIEFVAPEKTVAGSGFDLQGKYLADLSDVGIEATADGGTKLLFTKQYEGIIFDLSDEDMTKYAGIKIVANVPDQLSTALYSSSLDKATDEWWTVYKLKDFYPFYKGTDGEKKEEILDLTKVSEEKLADAKYLSIGCNNFAEGDYIIYSVEFLTELPSEEDPTETDKPPVESGDIENPPVESGDVEDPTETDKPPVESDEVEEPEIPAEVELELSSNNVVTIAASAGQYAGGGTIDVSGLLTKVENFKLSNYTKCTIYGTITKGGKDCDDWGIAQWNLLKGPDWTDDALFASAAYNVRNTPLKSGMSSTLKAGISENPTQLRILMQKATDDTNDEIVVTITKVVLSRE